MEDQNLMAEYAGRPALTGTEGIGQHPANARWSDCLSRWRVLKLVLLTGLFVTTCFLDVGEHGPEKQVQFAHRLYSSTDSTARGPAVAGSAPAGMASWSIAFEGLATDDHYDNFFQTSDDSHAIRVELQHPNTLNLILGNIKLAQLTSSFELHRPHTIVIRGRAGTAVECILDAKQVFFSNTQTLTTFDYHFDKVVVGAGFARKRGLQGTVRDFAFTASYTLPGPRLFTLGIRLALIAIGLGIACVAFPRHAAYSRSFAVRLARKTYIMVFRPALSSETGLSQESKVKGISAIVLAGFAAAVFFHYAAANYWHMEYPWTTFLITPEVAFSDFYVPLQDAADLNPYAPGPTGGYGPFAYLILYAVSKIPQARALVAYMLISVTFLLLFNWHALRRSETWIRAHGAFVLTFLSYPVLMVLDRGNTDGFLFVLIAWFVLAYQKGERKLSIVLLASAIAMKVFFVVFILLFIADKRNREAVATLTFAALLTLIGLCCLRGGLVHNIHQYLAKLAHHSDFYAMDEVGLRFNSSLYATIRTLFNVRSPEACLRLYGVYKWFCLALLLGLGVYLRYLERSFWRRVSLVTIAMVFLPSMNYDYRLVFLGIPLALFLNERSARFDPLYIFAFGLLLVPKAYYQIQERITISGVLNASLLLALILLHLYEGWLCRTQGKQAGDSLMDHGSDRTDLLLRCRGAA